MEFSVDSFWESVIKVEKLLNYPFITLYIFFLSVVQERKGFLCYYHKHEKYKTITPYLS